MYPAPRSVIPLKCTFFTFALCVVSASTFAPAVSLSTRIFLNSRFSTFPESCLNIALFMPLTLWPPPFILPVNVSVTRHVPACAVSSAWFSALFSTLSAAFISALFSMLFSAMFSVISAAPYSVKSRSAVIVNLPSGSLFSFRISCGFWISTVIGDKFTLNSFNNGYPFVSAFSTSHTDISSLSVSV